MARIEIRCTDELKKMLEVISKKEFRNATQEIESLIRERYFFLEECDKEWIKPRDNKDTIILQDESEPIPQGILNKFRHRGNL